MRQTILGGLWLAGCVSLLVTLGLQADAGAYESAAVVDGGVVRGKVTFKGTIPEPKEFELRRYADEVFCGALSDGKGLRLLKEVNVGANGELRDVVVVVEGIRRGKPFTFTDAKMEANICQFLPFVTVVSDKRQVTVINRDPVAHD